MQRRRTGAPEASLAPGAQPQKPSESTEAFYASTGHLLHSNLLLSPLRSPNDGEILGLLKPAVLALVLEPIQATVDTVVVATLGVTPLGAVGLGTVLFQFAIGVLGVFMFATTPAVAAHSRTDSRQASLACAHGMQIAAVVGVALQILVWSCAPDVITFMSTDVEVASLSILYLRARSWGIPAALVMMVGIGAARGHRNMKGPLYGSLAYLAALAALDVGLVLGLGWGVEGAGWAATVAQVAGAAAIIGTLVQRSELDPRHLLAAPSVTATLRYARMAPSMALNSVAALAPMLLATSIATGMGPEQLAAHTVLRQLTGYWQQGFVAFNATAHSLAASKMSEGPGSAADVLVRICQLAVACSIPVATVLFLYCDSLPGIFTGDAFVTSEVLTVLPLLLTLVPLDALGTVLEGGILGAADATWVAKRTLASSVVSVAALSAAATGHGSLAAIWCSLKLLNLGALLLDLSRFLRPAFRQPGNPLLSHLPAGKRHSS